MTSSNGNIFRVTDPLCGEFTGPGEFPTQRPVTRSFDVFFDLRLNKRLSKHSWGWWFETLSWSLWRYHNGYHGIGIKSTYHDRVQMAAFMQTTFWNAFWNGNLCILIANSLKCVCLDNGLSPYRQQHFIWTTVDQDVCMTSLGHNVLQKCHVAWYKTMEPHVDQITYISNINDGYFHSCNNQ